MIERVARAIYEKRNGAGCVPWSRRDRAHKAPYMDDARAAIEEMREPTDEMVGAATIWLRDTVYDGTDWIHVKNSYYSALDAALAEVAE